MSSQELDLGRTAAEYTARAQRFMRMARQMGNIMIDYDIYLASLQLLIDMIRLVNNSDPPFGIGESCRSAEGFSNFCKKM